MIVPIKCNFYKHQKPHIINRRLLHATTYMALIYRNVVLKIITCGYIERVAKINGMSCTSIGVSRRKCLEGQRGA